MTFVAAAIGGALGYGVAGTATGALLGAAVGGQLGSSMNQAQAAQSAANQQYQATQDASAQQRQMSDILNAQQAPYRQAGYSSLNKIQEMLPQFTKTFTCPSAPARGIGGVEWGIGRVEFQLQFKCLCKLGGGRGRGLVIPSNCCTRGVLRAVRRHFVPWSLARSSSAP